MSTKNPGGESPEATTEANRKISRNQERPQSGGRVMSGQRAGYAANPALETGRHSETEEALIRASGNDGKGADETPADTVVEGNHRSGGARTQDQEAAPDRREGGEPERRNERDTVVEGNHPKR